VTFFTAVLILNISNDILLLALTEGKGRYHIAADQRERALPHDR